MNFYESAKMRRRRQLPMNQLNALLRRELKTVKHAADRIAFLVRWAAVKARKCPTPLELTERRAAFRRGNPRGKTLMGHCWVCAGWASVYTHHIIQLQHGGSNQHFNYVRICGECHAVVHPWLPKPTEKTLHAPVVAGLDVVPF